jgi:regulatory subunit for Cdc7p protein kinase
MGDGYKPQFPILHCHPHARGPFIPFDEKEKRRYERSQRIEKEKEAEQEKLREKERLRRMAEAQKQYRKPMDLRRSVSMSNLQNQYQQDIIDYDETVAPDSANASGYLASGTGGYIAASGNSVGITSTTGTTSTGGNNPLRTAHLPASLRAQAQREVVTSRKATLRNAKRSNMGPPEEIPDRPHVLRKSRSTNTMRLPKREEGSKPGYCESCRTKFDDFKVVNILKLMSKCENAHVYSAYQKQEAPQVCGQ